MFSSVPSLLGPQSNVKLPLSSQPSSPKINVLQNITVPSIKTEIKNETPSIQIDEENDEELETSSPQPSCSNENQVPKVQKSVVTTTKSSQAVVMKPGDIHKSIKLCPKKAMAKSGSAGQKLIVVSAPQPVAPSMLHRALTVPVVKNLDKFKIVSTTAATSTTLPMTAVKNAGNSLKHKVVTVRTNSLPKKVSLTHLQFLNAKGSIKVLPFGGKIITRTTTIPSSNLILVNSGDSKGTVKSIASTPVIFSTKPHDALTMKSAENENLAEQQSKDEQKSSVLAEILKASGVTAADSENCEEENVTNHQELQPDPSFQIDDNIVQEITAEQITEDSCIDETKDMEDSEELVEISSIESLTCEENSAGHSNETCEIEKSYMVLGKFL